MLHCIYLIFFVYLIFLHDYYQMDAGEGKITTFKWDKEDLKSQKRTTKSQGAPNLWKKCHGISGYVRDMTVKTALVLFQTGGVVIVPLNKCSFNGAAQLELRIFHQ